MGIPEQLGRYKIKKKLGGGGMGAVYLVENTELQREEALKVPHFEYGDHPEVRANVSSARRRRRPGSIIPTCARSITPT